MSTMATRTVFTTFDQVLTKYFPKRAARLHDEASGVLFESTLADEIIEHIKKELHSLSSKKAVTKTTAAKRKKSR